MSERTEVNIAKKTVTITITLGDDSAAGFASIWKEFAWIQFRDDFIQREFVKKLIKNPKLREALLSAHTLNVPVFVTSHRASELRFYYRWWSLRGSHCLRLDYRDSPRDLIRLILGSNYQRTEHNGELAAAVA